MAYRTIAKAAADIIDIFLHGLGRFGPAQAERYHAGLEELFGRIASQPLLMRERQQFHPPVRLHPYRAHLIVHLVENSGDVLIVRFLRGRQDREGIVSG